MNIFRYILLIVSIFALAACGGGGDGSPARTATLKLSTTGTPSAQLRAVDITITLPEGVTPLLKSDGTVVESVATVSGVAATGAIPGVVLAPVYTPATAGAKGTLNITFTSLIVSGFGSGEFGTVLLNVATGKNPAQSDFTLSGFTPVDINGNNATGLNAVLASMTVL